MKKLFYLFILISLSAAVHAQSGRSVLYFDQNWMFNLGDVPNSFFKEWHKCDLTDQILRDRNHPSVIIWSIGNEIAGQRDTSGALIALELARFIHDPDTTRPITTGNNEPGPGNKIVESGLLTC